MKKIRLWGLLIVVAFSSCLQEPEPKQEAINFDPHYISVEQAIRNMNSAMSQLYTGTRATRGYTIQTLKGKDLRKAGTRSDATPLPEDLVYIVNFENEEGFAVLGADDRLEPVIAITERGSLKKEDIVGDKKEPNYNEEGENSDSEIDVNPSIVGSLIKNYIWNEIELEANPADPLKFDDESDSKNGSDNSFWFGVFNVNQGVSYDNPSLPKPINDFSADLGITILRP